MSFTLSTGAVVLGLSAIFSGVAVAIYDPIGSYKYPASDGQRYLQQDGYKNISGGERDYSGVCRGVARAYTAEKDGVETKEIICFSKLFWAHRPQVR